VREKIKSSDFYADTHMVEFSLESDLDRAAAQWFERKGRGKVTWTTLTIFVDSSLWS
jgi:hypothetical protein